MKISLPSPSTVATLGLTCAIVTLSACGSKETTVRTKEVSGARSGIVSIGLLMEETDRTIENPRTAALIGIFVSQYLSLAPSASAAEGALLGIGAQMQIVMRQSTVDDPDYDLLQAFADALQVDVPDLLNRSINRQEALDSYTQALTNVATRANDRFKELESALEALTERSRTEKKELSTAERELNTALREKDFSKAGELQKTVNEKQAVFAETDLKKKQVSDLVDTLDNLLTLYSQKILAIQANREALIAGTKVVDVPGIEELDVIERTRRMTPRRSGADGFDSLFEDTNTL